MKHSFVNCYTQNSPTVEKAEYVPTASNLISCVLQTDALLRFVRTFLQVVNSVCAVEHSIEFSECSFMFAQTFTQLWNFSFNEGIKRLDAVNAKRKCSRPINKAYELHLAVGLSACLTSTLWSVHVNLFWPELAFTSLKAQYRCLSYLVQGKGAVICTAWIQSSDGSVSYIVLVSVFGILVGYY